MSWPARSEPAATSTGAAVDGSDPPPSQVDARLPGAREASARTWYCPATYLRRVREKLRALGVAVETKLELRDAALEYGLLD